MGGMLSVVKTIVVPAAIAFAVYAALTFVLIPAWQQWRNRYSHYLPLESIATSTSSFRHRVQSALGRFLVPSAWRERLRERVAAGDFGIASSAIGGLLGGVSISNGVEFLSDEEESEDDIITNRHGFVVGEEAGEELGAMPRAGPERLPRAGIPGAYNTSRLSRDLEQGFMDDSEDDEPPRPGR